MKTMTYRTARQAIARADLAGAYQPTPGVYLYTSDAIREEWKALAPDLAAAASFRTSPYWLTDAAGHGPTRIRNARDLAREIRRHARNVPEAVA